MAKGQKITVQDLVDAISTRSVVDPYAADNALTVFYSGESEKFINTLVEQAGENVRIIRHTEAYKLLANEDFNDIVYYAVQQDNPGMSDEAVEKEVSRLFNEASYYDKETGVKVEGEGFWAEISRRFAADTKGDAYSLCTNAKADRIYAMDELENWLANVDDNCKMGGYTKAELLQMSETECFVAVKQWTINDMKNSILYFDEKGVKVGQTFEGTFLENYLDSIATGNCAFETDLYSYTQFSDEEKMIKTFGEYDYANFTELEKLQAKQMEYWMRQLPDASNNICLNITDDMLYSDNVINAGVKVVLQNDAYEYINGVSRQDLQLVYSSGTAGEQSVMEILKATAQDATDISQAGERWFAQADYIEPGKDKYTIKNCYDKAGKFVGVEFTQTGSDVPIISQATDAAIKVDISEFSDFAQYADDAKMAETFGYENYTNFTDLEKMQAKKVEYLSSKFTNLQDVPIDNQTFSSYLVATGKTVDQLDDIDRMMIKIGDGMANKSPDVSKLLNAASKYDNIFKVAGKVGGVVDFVGTTCVVAYSINNAIQAYERGDVNTAAGIVTGMVTEITVSAVGGSVITGAISPYLIGLGAAVGGPVGAVVGGVLAGVIGYGLAGLAGSELNDIIVDLFSDLDNNYAAAGNAVHYVADPLVFDMDGDGFELKSLEDGVYFDENNFGLKEKTQWVADDDGLLALDLNEDGTINDGSELFGTSTVLTDGTIAKSGFEALAQHDQNADGVIDKNDAVFSELLVWQDKNSDGISQQDELFALEKLGIESISLNYTDDNGTNVAAVAFEDGTTSKVGEFFFEAQLYDSIEKEQIEISEEIKSMPNIQAIGNVASLHTLMQLDETGNLVEYVNRFAQATSVEEKQVLVTNILYFITGADAIGATSRGGNFDAQKLTVIEAFLGKDFVGTAGSNPVNTAANILGEIYDNIYEMYYNLLNAETSLKDYMNMTFWLTDENGERYLDTTIFDAYVACHISEAVDMKDVVAEMGRYILALNSSNEENFKDFFMTYADKEDYAKAIAAVSDRVVLGTEGKDSLSITNSGSFIFGLRGDDALYGSGGDDVFYAGEGNDSIYAGYGNDVLNGGAGNDTLYGDRGADTYVFNLGDGQDVINNYDNANWSTDRIRFGEGIREEDIEISRSGNNMVLRNVSSGDSVTVRDAYQNGYGYQYVGSVEFADGTVWDMSELRKRTKTVINGGAGNDSLSLYTGGYNYTQGGTINAGGGNDSLYGSGGADILNGESGNDSISAGYGNDVLNGGAGNDTLYGDRGADTYVFNLGDGQDVVEDYDTTSGNNDTLVFGEEARNLMFARSGSDLLVSIIDTEDSVTIKNWYQSNYYKVESIQANDGYSLSHKQVDLLIQSMASFESTSGMSWADGIRTNHESIDNITLQTWIKQETEL